MTIGKKGGYQGGKAPSAKTFRNPDFFKIGGDQTVTVSVTFDMSAKGGEEIALRNAADALRFYSEYNRHNSWVRKIEVK